MNTASARMRVLRWVTTFYDLYLHWLSRWQKPGLWSELPRWLAARRHHYLCVATVNFCNARCVFCGQHRFKRPSGTMSETTFSRALQSYGMGFRELDFTPPLGDPLLDDELFDRAMAARALGFERLIITTNGILLAREEVRAQCLGWFDEIRVSVGGLDRESYRGAYGVDRFDAVWEGLFLLCRDNGHRAQPRKILIFFRSIRTAGELTAHPKFKLLTDCAGVVVEFTNRYDNWGGSVKDADLIGDMKMRHPPKKSGVPCRGLAHYFVEHQGNVRLCGCRFHETENDGLVIGNVNEQPLKEILAGPRVLAVMESFRDGESDKLPGVCRGCTLYRPMTRSFLQAHS